MNDGLLCLFEVEARKFFFTVMIFFTIASAIGSNAKIQECTVVKQECGDSSPLPGFETLFQR